MSPIVFSTVVFLILLFLALSAFGGFLIIAIVDGSIYLYKRWKRGSRNYLYPSTKPKNKP